MRMQKEHGKLSCSLHSSMIIFFYVNLRVLISLAGTEGILEWWQLSEGVKMGGRGRGENKRRKR